eukprot:13267581-Alexandrium_andersonii.AAC.1
MYCEHSIEPLGPRAASGRPAPCLHRQDVQQALRTCAAVCSDSQRLAAACIGLRLFAAVCSDLQRSAALSG